MAVAATIVLIIGGLWVITRRDTVGTGTPGDTTEAGDLDFSGTHRAAMEAEFPPDPGAPMLESALLGSKSGTYELETASRQRMVACMNAAGFEFPLPTLTRAAIQSDVSQIIRPLTPESAAQHAYDGAPSVSAVSGSTPEAYRATLSNLKQQLFDTRPRRNAAHERPKTSSPTTPSTRSASVKMEEQRNSFIVAFNAALQVRSLDAEWSSCMNAKGLTASNIADAYELGRHRYQRSKRQGHRHRRRRMPGRHEL